MQKDNLHLDNGFNKLHGTNYHRKGEHCWHAMDGGACTITSSTNDHTQENKEIQRHI